MKTTLTKGLDAEKARIISTQFDEGKVLRRRLSEIVNEKLKTKHAESRTKEGYANPNWAYFQADAIGYERALTEILSILED